MFSDFPSVRACVRDETAGLHPSVSPVNTVFHKVLVMLAKFVTFVHLGQTSLYELIRF